MHKNDPLQTYVKKKKEAIDSRLDTLVPESNGDHAALYQAARYTLCAPGKRLRPILTLATAEMLQGDSDHALTPACAIEMIHAYSMIHDDLPCMDNDDFRRGKPSLHKAFSESTAVLAGDFLLTNAFEVLAESPGINHTQKIALITTLAKSAGGEGMIGGQLMDLESEEKNVDLKALHMIHHKKTAALFCAALDFGAIIANTSPGIRHQLRRFAESFGHAFQVIDDIVDVTRAEEKHGKITGSDLINKKATFVSHLGLEKAKKQADQLIDTAINHLHQLACNTTFLEKMIATLYLEQISQEEKDASNKRVFS